MSRETKIIALTGKGGVGKTSISAALVKLLVEEFPEKKILAIDADPAIGPVSYTHLDVYKRQRWKNIIVWQMGNQSLIMDFMG